MKGLKFYKETDGALLSFEAKFKTNGSHFSIEFDAIGNLQDIEILTKIKHIPKEVFAVIFNYFKTHFSKVRFIKIQRQYINSSGQSDTIFITDIIKNPSDDDVHYEIIAEVKTQKDRLLKEFTFTNMGAFKTSRLITSATYEHALY